MIGAPTLGRVVWFKARNGELCPAVVTKVFGELRIALHAFEAGQPCYPEKDVPFDQTRTALCSWSWPPKPESSQEKEPK